jgi:hypothetical protein
MSQGAFVTPYYVRTVMSRSEDDTWRDSENKDVDKPWQLRRPVIFNAPTQSEFDQRDDYLRRCGVGNSDSCEGHGEQDQGPH